ncbi:DUF3805 domain-containing protein [Leptospira wolffii]|uniref:DUF3805 domain-containing protein n=1 Tax=Leptospira wolffii TaxID=409998 RepID=A0ABV5BTP8_9LEPT|nr:DUF3805 domain-containing protein [Leptospira wolffii]
MIFNYPADWKYSKEEERTHLFYDEKAGSFRITPIIFPKENLSNVKVLESIVTDVDGTVRPIRIKELFIFKSQRSYKDSDGDLLVNTNWYFGKEHILILASYTILEELSTSDKGISALKDCENIIGTMQFGSQ